MPLSDTAVRNLKPLEKAYKKSDSNGLYLLVKPNGTKLWRYDYSLFGSRKTLAIGAYPMVSLAEARKARDEAKSAIASNVDPVNQKRQLKFEAAEVAANTFGKIAEEFLQKMQRDGRSEQTMIKNHWMLRELASPLTERPIAEIRPKEILAILRKLEDSGRIESASATRAAIGRVFRFAIALDIVDTDPTYALRGALTTHKPEHFAAITDPVEVGGLVRAVKASDGWPTLRAVLLMQMYCFARPGETRTMMWSELDLRKRVWSIPAEKTKMRRPLDVPLSRQAIEVIESVRVYSGTMPCVFRSMMSGKMFLSENSMNSALRRMGFTKEQHTAHGFRSTASTLLNESRRFRGEVIEAQLAHKDKDVVRAIYNRANYWDERVTMMQWWADYLDELGASR